MANESANTLTPDEQIAMAGQLRQAKSGKGEEENNAETAEPRSLREKVMAARREMDIKQRAKDKIKEKITEPAKQGTNSALRWAWTTLIPSWGLSLIYINLHVFLKMVFGEKLFCKLGDEWIPKQIQSAGGEAGKTAGRAIGIAEVMGLVLIDLIIGFIIFGALAFIVIIVSWITSPWEALKAIFDLGWGGVKALVDLFI